MVAESSAKHKHVDMSRAIKDNEKYWDDYAASFDHPDQAKVDAKVTKDLQTHKEWIGVDWFGAQDAADKTVRVLDYACGPGVISRAFLPYATELRGIDVAQNMAEQYNRWAKEHNLYPTKMAAIKGDLADVSGPSESTMAPEYFNFDLAAVGAALHHFPDPTLAAKRLVERLKPGKGVLLILDTLPREISADTPARHTITRHGFSDEEIRGILEEAGCEDIKTVGLGEITSTHKGLEYTVDLFLARGTRKLEED